MQQQLGPQFGILKPFDGVDFTDYSERLNSYFISSNIGQVADDASEAVKLAAGEKKVAVTTSLIGKIHVAYRTLKDLCLPDLPATNSQNIRPAYRNLEGPLQTQSTQSCRDLLLPSHCPA